MINLNDIVVLRIRQVADAPLKALCCVLPDKHRVGGGSCKQVLFWVKPLALITDFILPCGLSELLRTLPFTQQKFIACLITLLNQLGLIGEQVMELAATVR